MGFFRFVVFRSERSSGIGRGDIYGHVANEKGNVLLYKTSIIWLKLKRPIASKLVILIKKEVFNYFFNFKPISMVKIKGTAKNHTNTINFSRQSSISMTLALLTPIPISAVS